MIKTNITKRQLIDKKRAFKHPFISHLTARITRLENRQISNIRSIIRAADKISASTENMNDSAEKIRTIIGSKPIKDLGKEFDRLMQMPQVRGLRFSSDNRRLYMFLEITSRKNGKKYCWKINIPANGDSEGTYRGYRGILFTGYTGSYATDSYNNRSWCLGNVAGDANRYVEKYEFDALVALLIELLEDNTGREGDVIRTKPIWKTQLGKLGSIQEQRKTYMNICSKREYWLAPFHENIITSESKNMEEPLKSLREARTNDHTLEIEVLKKRKNNKLRVLAQEFDKIAAMPDLQSISIADNSLFLTTEPLSISHEENSKPIGSFQIRINTDCLIRIRPLDAGDNKIAHPSIKDDVILMKPALRISLAKLLAGHRFSDVISILLDFLKTYDPQLAFEPPQTGEKRKEK